jgi:hypothetical protein
MAMGEASKLFDQHGGSGGDRQDAVNGAAMTVTKLLVQSKFSGMTGGGNSGGLGALAGMVGGGGNSGSGGLGALAGMVGGGNSGGSGGLGGLASMVRCRVRFAPLMLMLRLTHV